MTIASLFFCSAASLSSLFHTRRNHQLSLSRGLHSNQLNRTQLLRYDRGTLVKVSHDHEMFESGQRFPKGHNVLFAFSEDQPEYSEIKPENPKQENNHLNAQDVSISNSSYYPSDISSGKAGQISFYNHPNKREDEVHISGTKKGHDSILWFIGPAVLVASFVFPHRRLSSVFDDSLLTDFLILFFTEALFYCGVAVFLRLSDHLRRPNNPESATSSNNLSLQLGQQISYVAAFVLSIIIPMVTMGYVWSWIGPAASATLAPYVVYRLHQLNRAAQLVTSHNMAINNSLVLHPKLLHTSTDVLPHTIDVLPPTPQVFKQCQVHNSNSELSVGVKFFKLLGLIFKKLLLFLLFLVKFFLTSVTTQRSVHI